MTPSDGPPSDRPPLPAALTGWFVAGSHPDHYEVGVGEPEDPTRRVASFRSKPQPLGFGTLMQTFQAGSYRSTRQMLTARIRSADVEEWAGLWMRVDGEHGALLSFDNMQTRPITGTTDWTEYRVVLDVPADAVHIALGVLMEGAGAVWIEGVQLREVGQEVPTTGAGARSRTGPAHEYPAGPVNLDFGHEG